MMATNGLDEGDMMVVTKRYNKTNVEPMHTVHRDASSHPLLLMIPVMVVIVVCDNDAELLSRALSTKRRRN